MATKQFCIVFNLLEHNPYLDLTYALLKAVGDHLQWRWTEPSSLATEQFCIVFNLFEHNPYLDLTYALLKAVGGHHQRRWTEPSSLATEQFFMVFNIFFVDKKLFLTYLNTDLYHRHGAPKSIIVYLRSLNVHYKTGPKFLTQSEKGIMITTDRVGFTSED